MTGSPGLRKWCADTNYFASSNLSVSDERGGFGRLLEAPKALPAAARVLREVPEDEPLGGRIKVWRSLSSAGAGR
jgi:hypothetical protein